MMRTAKDRLIHGSTEDTLGKAHLISRRRSKNAFSEV